MPPKTGMSMLLPTVPQNILFESPSASTAGITVRSSYDCVIAAIAIENKVPVWHRDRDYRSIARYTPLREIDTHRALTATG